MNEQEFPQGPSPWLLRPVCMAKMLHGSAPASSQGGSRLAKPLAAEN